MLLNATANSSIDTNTGSRTASRKDEHLRININQDVAAKGVETGFDDWRFVHRALPEIDLDAVELRTSLLGRPVGAPLLVSCMTGGTEQTRVINEQLARVAQAHGLAMGLGSCRVLLERPDVLPTFDVRALAPDVPLLANLGAVQLNLGVGIEECRHLLRVLRADALVLHLVRPRRRCRPRATRVRGSAGRIAAVCAGLGAPVVVKEVGWGIADDLGHATLRRRGGGGRRRRCRRHILVRGRARSHARPGPRAHRSRVRRLGHSTTDALLGARSAARTAC